MVERRKGCEHMLQECAQRFTRLEMQMSDQCKDINTMQEHYIDMRDDVKNLKLDVANIKTDMAETKYGIKSISERMPTYEKKFDIIEIKIDKILEHQLEKAEKEVSEMQKENSNVKGIGKIILKLAGSKNGLRILTILAVALGVSLVILALQNGSELIQWLSGGK